MWNLLSLKISFSWCNRLAYFHPLSHKRSVGIEGGCESEIAICECGTTGGKSKIEAPISQTLNPVLLIYQVESKLSVSSAYRCYRSSLIYINTCKQKKIDKRFDNAIQVVPTSIMHTKLPSYVNYNAIN